jgi:hypothetical protein
VAPVWEAAFRDGAAQGAAGRAPGARRQAWTGIVMAGRGPGAQSAPARGPGCCRVLSATTDGSAVVPRRP